MENYTNIDPTHDNKSPSPPEEPLPWQPGGARGGNKLDLKNGEQYLMVVRLAGRLNGGEPWMDWHVVEVSHGPNGVIFHSNGWTWTWSDVTYCLPLAKLKLPNHTEKPPPTL